MLLGGSFHQDLQTGGFITLLVKEVLDYLVVMGVQLEEVQEVQEVTSLAEVVEEVLEVLADLAAWEAMVVVVVVEELEPMVTRQVLELWAVLEGGKEMVHVVLRVGAVALVQVLEAEFLIMVEQ